MYDYHDLNDRKMRLRDWRKALRTPATYRVGNTVRLQPHFIMLIVVICVFLVILFYYNWLTSYFKDSRQTHYVRPYNYTYPFTTPSKSGHVVTYKIAIVADLDTNSKSKTIPNTYNSYLKKGLLDYNAAENRVVVRWDEGAPVLLSSTYSQKGRGMELSELIVYDGRLLSFDDRSGMVFEIINNKMIPWVILADGNGRMEKGFKSEWATVKDEMLYIGSMGKEWTTNTGKFETNDPMWIKIVNTEGQVQHLNWVNQYKAIRSSIGIQWPGYMIHESGVWSAIKQKWHFLPRRCCKESYNETNDELMGCNYLITADDSFGSVQHFKITKHQPKLGFSSFKFIPGTADEVILALKTTEHDGKTSTYITAFNTNGAVLLDDTLIENVKYEGLEFI